MECLPNYCHADGTCECWRGSPFFSCQLLKCLCCQFSPMSAAQQKETLAAWRRPPICVYILGNYSDKEMAP